MLVGIITPNAIAEDIEIPLWIKNNAGWWATDQIDDITFLLGIEYLIKEEIMVIPLTETSESSGSQIVPSWIKNNAGWWANGLIDDISFVSGIQWLISNGIIIVEEKLIQTEPNLRVAFIGDQGITPSSIAVLNMIKDEGAQMVLHQGDLYYEIDYRDTVDPDAWDKMITDVLGNDFPYFPVVGNHDYEVWNEYQKKSHDRFEKNPDVKCTGDIGVQSFCTYKGLFVVQTGSDLLGTNHGLFIEDNLKNNDHLWRICSWSKNMTEMQVGGKTNTVGWEVYENCKNNGAIIATAHEHTYHRTKTLVDIQNQIVDSTWSKPDKIKVDDGSTFVFVSGMGGWSIRDQDRCLPISYPYGCKGEWANIYTSDQHANFGALFCTFNVAGQPNKAFCYFKNIDGRIVDAFTITNFLGVNQDDHNILEFDKSGNNLTGDDLSNKIMIDGDLSNAILAETDLSNSVLIGTKLVGADLTDANLNGVIFNGNDLTDVILRGADLTDARLSNMDLSNKDLTGTILREADLTGANLNGVDFSNKDLTDTILREADLTGANLNGVDLYNRDLTGAILRNVDLSNHDLTYTILNQVDFTNSKLPSDYLSEKDFRGKPDSHTIFDEVNLSGMNLYKSDFQYSSFKNTNLKNANLEGTLFLVSDLTGAELDGASLFGASFAHSNLADVSLNGATITLTNFNNSELPGRDFTVVEDIGDGSSFTEATLTNSNFEGLTLSPKNEYSQLFKNKAQLADLDPQELLEELFPDTHIIITHIEISGNDLIVNFALLNSFAHANLENANFKNTILWNITFKDANFSNADLSGADLTNTFLGGTNLTNTNLFGANLEDAIIDETTILKCKNHPMCLD